MYWYLNSFRQFHFQPRICNLCKQSLICHKHCCWQISVSLFPICFLSCYHYFFVFSQKKVPQVPESLLKKRKKANDQRAKKVQLVAKAKKVKALLKNFMQVTLIHCLLCLYSCPTNVNFCWILGRLNKTNLLHIDSNKVILLQERKEKRLIMFKRAEKYVKEYRTKERDQIRMKRQARKQGNFYVPPQADLAFVMRIRG